MELQIAHIEDVLPHLVEGHGIFVNRRPSYQVIDYGFVVDETFSSEVALQCRGLKFDEDGVIIARPFHKFFNIGEREDPKEMDWTRPHVVLDKLDGSMIHPARINGELVFMTRAGVTDHARAALAFASERVLKLCDAELNAGRTPIFEFTGPENRVVVLYETPALTLLASREILTGRYLGLADLEALARAFDVPLVQQFGTVDDVTRFVAEGRALEGVEGYVVAFEDGHRVKLKAEAYALRHKALSAVHLEKNVLQWITAEALDDVLPLLNDDAAALVADYKRQVDNAVAAAVEQIEHVTTAQDGKSRKELALAVQAELPKHLRSAAFAVVDGRSARDAVMKHLSWAAHSQPRVDQVRPFYGLSWNAAHLTEIEPG
ncbi:MAG: RNA ligase [Pseudomonadota bacterium]